MDGKQIIHSHINSPPDFSPPDRKQIHPLGKFTNLRKFSPWKIHPFSPPEKFTSRNINPQEKSLPGIFTPRKVYDPNWGSFFWGENI